MCKLFAIVEIENKENAEKFAKKAVRFVTEHDDDGLGIMRLGENGVHVQRWVEVPLIPTMRSTLNRFKNVLDLNRNMEGKRSRRLYGIGIHGRWATCEVNIQNTHPFYRNGTALMHNGVIKNHDEFDKPLSTCDSEALLTRYIEAGAKRHPRHLTDALRPISGYFAAIVFNDNGTIDIWCDNKATLYMAHVKGVGVVIATTAGIILNTARECKYLPIANNNQHRTSPTIKVTAINKIKPFTVIRWNKGRNPIIKRFSHDTPTTTTGIPTNCGTQRSLFPDDGHDEFSHEPVSERGNGWADLDALNDDYEIAKLGGFKGTQEDYFRQMEIDITPLEDKPRGNGEN